jgi:hypothetical protein
MSNQVYLSSTLDDLRPYREAALEALRRAGYIVKDSYKATAEPTVEQCLSDIRESDIYVGVFAGRYGWRPDGHDGKSITELEYREAVKAGMRRFIFIRPLEDCAGKDLDSVKGDYDADTRLKALRAELQNGTGHTCALFTTPSDLALKVTQALPPATPPSGIFQEPPPHPSQLSTGLLIVAIRGSDEAAAERIRSNLPRTWQAGSTPFGPEPAQLGADRLALDQKLARTRCVALYLTQSGLERLKENGTAGNDLACLLATRLGGYSILLDGISQADLPASWPAPVAAYPIGTWLAAGTDTMGGELAALVKDFPDAAPSHQDVTNTRLVGLAYSVLAMTKDEAVSLEAQPELVKDGLGRPSFDIFTSHTLRLKGAGHWADRYGPSRRDWQPFGNGSVKELLDEVVSAINLQTIVPKRDQNALLGNRIRLRYYPFEPATFKPGSPDWPLLEAMRARGCLILVDELSTLHPILHGKGNVFLSDPAVTVATLSGIDPSVCSLDDLIDSPQKIDALVDRFSNKLDPRCELAINNKARVRRWLRLSVPEALAGAEAQGADPDRRSQFRAALGGRI